MERTAEGERPEGAAKADADAHAARAKARAYLDLWESHVVQTALYGPVAPWRPAKS